MNLRIAQTSEKTRWWRVSLWFLWKSFLLLLTHEEARDCPFWRATLQMWLLWEIVSAKVRLFAPHESSPYSTLHETEARANCWGTGNIFQVFCYTVATSNKSLELTIHPPKSLGQMKALLRNPSWFHLNHRRRRKSQKTVTSVKHVESRSHVLAISSHGFQNLIEFCKKFEI